MTLRDQILADRVTVFLNPEDFAESVVMLLPDLATEVTLVGVWSDTASIEDGREHDLVTERVARLLIKREDLPTEDAERCRFWRAADPDAVFAVRGTPVQSSQSGMAIVTLVKTAVIDRHARDGYRVVRGGGA